MPYSILWLLIHKISIFFSIIICQLKPFIFTPYKLTINNIAILQTVHLHNIHCIIHHAVYKTIFTMVHIQRLLPNQIKITNFNNNNDILHMHTNYIVSANIQYKLFYFYVHGSEYQRGNQSNTGWTVVFSVFDIFFEIVENLVCALS